MRDAIALIPLEPAMFIPCEPFRSFCRKSEGFDRHQGRNRLVLAWMLYPNWENEMTTGEIGMLTLIIGALTLFGGVLGWASWQEARQRRKTQKG